MDDHWTVSINYYLIPILNKVKDAENIHRKGVPWEYQTLIAQTTDIM